MKTSVSVNDNRVDQDKLFATTEYRRITKLLGVDTAAVVSAAVRPKYVAL